MARTEYVKRALVRAGFDLQAYEFTPGSWWAEKSNRAKSEIVEFHEQDGKVHYLRVRGGDDHGDSQTDYSAGSYMENVKQAVELADSSLASALAWLEKHEAGECGIRNGWPCPRCPRLSLVQ